MAIQLENWFPQSPLIGPPLPKWMGITWPWYKEVPPTPPTPPAPPAPTAPGYTCPYCDQSFDTLQELIEHVATDHQDKPPLGEIAIAWE